MFFVHTKTQSKRLEERFRKLRFCDGLVWTVGEQA